MSHNRGVVTLQDEAVKLVHSFTKTEINQLLASRHPNALKVITMRYGLADGVCRTNKSIGEKLGFSRERARYLEKRGLLTLRKTLELKQV